MWKQRVASPAKSPVPKSSTLNEEALRSTLSHLDTLLSSEAQDALVVGLRRHLEDPSVFALDKVEAQLSERFPLTPYLRGAVHGIAKYAEALQTFAPPVRSNSTSGSSGIPASNGASTPTGLFGLAKKRLSNLMAPGDISPSGVAVIVRSNSNSNPDIIPSPGMRDTNTTTATVSTAPSPPAKPTWDEMDTNSDNDGIGSLESSTHRAGGPYPAHRRVHSWGDREGGGGNGSVSPEVASRRGPGSLDSSARGRAGVESPGSGDDADTDSEDNLKVVPGKWKKSGEIGKGSFGSVHLGLNEVSGHLIAVKVVGLQKPGMTPEIAEGIHREVTLMRKFRHPNIVRYLGGEIWAEEGVLYIFQEWLPSSITQLLKFFGPFKERRIAQVTKQILCGLKYLHSKRVLHRDIKNSNILIDDRGTVKLCDFGASKMLESDVEWDDKGTMERAGAALAGDHTRVGSPLFMAPEVLLHQSYGDKIDIWSLGGAILEMATGQPPWHTLKLRTPVALVELLKKTNAPPPIPDEISSSLRDMLYRCFARMPENRASAAELLSDPFLLMADRVEDITTEELEAGKSKNLDKMDDKVAAMRIRRASFTSAQQTAMMMGGVPLGSGPLSTSNHSRTSVPPSELSTPSNRRTPGGGGMTRQEENMPSSPPGGDRSGADRAGSDMVGSWGGGSTGGSSSIGNLQSPPERRRSGRPGNIDVGVSTSAPGDSSHLPPRPSPLLMHNLSNPGPPAINTVANSMSSPVQPPSAEGTTPRATSRGTPRGTPRNRQSPVLAPLGPIVLTKSPSAATQPLVPSMPMTPVSEEIGSGATPIGEPDGFPVGPTISPVPAVVSPSHPSLPPSLSLQYTMSEGGGGRSPIPPTSAPSRVNPYGLASPTVQRRTSVVVGGSTGQPIENPYAAQPGGRGMRRMSTSDLSLQGRGGADSDANGVNSGITPTRHLAPLGEKASSLGAHLNEAGGTTERTGGMLASGDNQWLRRRGRADTYESEEQSRPGSRTSSREPSLGSRLARSTEPPERRSGRTETPVERSDSCLERSVTAGLDDIAIAELLKDSPERLQSGRT